jgi:hypothetical protein
MTTADMIGTLEQADVSKSYEPREVHWLQSVRCGDRDDYGWVQLVPPILPGQAANTDTLEVVLLAPRHKGKTLTGRPVEADIHVYVCSAPRGRGFPAVVSPEDVTIRHWGLLRPRPAEADVGTTSPLEKAATEHLAYLANLGFRLVTADNEHVRFESDA